MDPDFHDWCNICNISVSHDMYRHTLGKRHKRFTVFPDYVPVFKHCDVCNIQVHEKSWHDHVDGQNHRRKLSSKVCSKCRAQFWALKSQYCQYCYPQMNYSPIITRICTDPLCNKDEDDVPGEIINGYWFCQYHIHR